MNLSHQHFRLSLQRRQFALNVLVVTFLGFEPTFELFKLAWLVSIGARDRGLWDDLVAAIELNTQCVNHRVTFLRHIANINDRGPILTITILGRAVLLFLFLERREHSLRILFQLLDMLHIVFLD